MTLFDQPVEAPPAPEVFSCTPDCLHPDSLTIVFSHAGMSGAGCRYLSASLLDTPGRVGQCRFVSLWCEMKENAPWSGEPWINAWRRVSEGTSWSREGFTEAAGKALRAALAAELHRYGGFDKAWRAAMRRPESVRYDGAGDAAPNAARLRELATWWDRVGEVAKVVAELGDRIEYRVVPCADRGRRPQQLRPTSHSGRGDVEWAEQVVALCLPDGEVFGYMTGDGKLLPLTGVSR